MYRFHCKNRCYCGYHKHDMCVSVCMGGCVGEWAGEGVMGVYVGGYMCAKETSVYSTT